MTIIRKDLGCLVVCFVLLLILFFIPRQQRTREPLTRQQAEDRLHIALPETATDIHYFSWGQWQAYVRYCRFTASIPDCMAFAKQHEPFDTYLVISPSSLAPRFRGYRTPPWFPVDAITNGATMFTGRSQYWIDFDTGRLYEYATD